MVLAKANGIPIWGIVILVINQVFNWHIPLWRIAFGIFFILLGINFLIGWGIKNPEQQGDPVIFAQSDMAIDMTGKTNETFETVFGHAVYNFSSTKFEKGTTKIKIDNVFGKTDIILPVGTPYSITMDTAFGAVTSPVIQVGGFGENSYTSDNYAKAKVKVDFEIHSVFGAVEIK